MSRSRGFLRLAKVLFLCMLTLALCACALVSTGSASLQRRFDSFNESIDTQREMTERDYIELVVKTYEEAFSAFRDSAVIDSLNPKDLDLLFRAAHTALSYSSQPKYAEDMNQLLSRLKAKGAASDIHFSYMFQAYVTTREFDRAAEVSQHHHTRAMEPLPEFILPDIPANKTPTELVVSHDKRQLTRRSVNLPDGPYIVVVFHPNCHFSQNASAAIAKDEELSALFRNHAKWLAPPRGNLDVDTLQRWNKAHQDTPVSIAYRTEEWRLIDSWALPTFYFFSNSELKAKVVGWPPQGQEQKLKAAALAIGLLPKP